MFLAIPLWVGMAAMVLAVLGFFGRLALTAVEGRDVPGWLDQMLKWLAVVVAVTFGGVMLLYAVAAAWF